MFIRIHLREERAKESLELIANKVNKHIASNLSNLLLDVSKNGIYTRIVPILRQEDDSGKSNTSLKVYKS